MALVTVFFGDLQDLDLSSQDLHRSKLNDLMSSKKATPKYDILGITSLSLSVGGTLPAFRTAQPQLVQPRPPDPARKYPLRPFPTY